MKDREGIYGIRIVKKKTIDERRQIETNTEPREGERIQKESLNVKTEWKTDKKTKRTSS